jgi:hypothetical protein
MHPSLSNSPSSSPSSQMPNVGEDLANHCAKLDEEVTFNQKFQLFKVTNTLMLTRYDNNDNGFHEMVERTIEDIIEKAKENEVKMKYMGIRISATHPKSEYGIPIRKLNSINGVVNEFMSVCHSKPPLYGKPFNITVTIVGDLNKDRT